jgi:SEC-C motif
MSQPPTVLDPVQLRRIEAVHRGFLYQHLFTVACLLSAPTARATAIIVEADEDIEIALPDGRVYAQIKTRSDPVTHADIDGAIDRFAKIRKEHASGAREGVASFLIVANIEPGPKLRQDARSGSWPSDVQLCWPGNGPDGKGLPAPWRDVPDGFEKCTELAATLPFGMLAPETLVWKLAGLVMAAAAGTPPKTDHAFRIDELPGIFEQLALQLQDFPTPPPRYRPQSEEPELVTTAQLRAITGFSGAGKTAWASQAAQQSNAEIAYFDVGDTPGPAIAIPLARELAGRFFSGSGLATILRPGATGLEMLRAIGLRLQSQGISATAVIDNAHRIPSDNLRAVVQQLPQLGFILLCRPGHVVEELETTLGLVSEPLRGWTADTIAAEVADAGCVASFASCQQLLDLTGGLPLYVQNAVRITAGSYSSDLARFCDELATQTHSVTTAQELILSKLFNGLPQRGQDAVAVLSMSDVALDRAEAAALLKGALGVDDKAFARVIRELRPTGVVEVFGGDRLKIHDAMRVLGRAHLNSLSMPVRQAARMALKDVLLASILRQRNLPKFSLYLRILAEIGDIKTLVQFATDEFFHELGLVQEITTILETTAGTETIAPDQRFSALDGLVFADFKRRDLPKATERLQLMARLVEEHSLDETDQLTLAMKEMSLAALMGNVDEVLRKIAQVSTLLPDKRLHQLIFRYNAAHALYDLGRFDACVSETSNLIQEYYDLLGIEPSDVIMKNPNEIFPLLKEGEDHTDSLKHLADCLDLQAKALYQIGKHSPFARIHAVKFYAMANALDSVARVGQDLVDEYVERHDYIGARDMLERNVLPNVIEHRLVDRIVPVRAQYAVVLAYCGEHDAAAAEMARLAPYEGGLDEDGRNELRRQRALIAQLRVKPPPPQWMFPAPPRKMGRNERCYCGSGKKFKHCHGKGA